MLVRLLLGVLVAVAAPVFAQYPDHPPKILVPFPPGGAADTFARLAADRLGAGWGKQMIVENRPGAGGIIATEAAAKVGARRLHVPDRHGGARGEPEPVRQAALRHARRFRAGDDGGERAERAGGASVGAGELGPGAGRAREEIAGEPQVRLVRQRDDLAHGGGAARESRRDRDAARAVQGCRARGAGSRRRADGSDARPDRLLGCVRQAGTAARACGHDRQAHADPA